MSDIEPPVQITQTQVVKAMKVGLVFKDKICKADKLFIVVDPDKEEEEQYIDVEVFVAFNEAGKCKVSMHQVS